MSGPAFELVVVSYHSARQISGLLQGLPSDLPVAVVDNARGEDGLEAVMAARPHGRYVDSGGGAGYARAANLGARTSRHPYLVMVNPDCRPDLAALETLVADVANDPSCASSAALNVGPDRRSEIGAAGWEPTLARAVVHAVGGHKLFPQHGLYARPVPGEPIRVDWTTGACMAVDRERFLALGCFDERFHVYSEDVAFGRTVRARGMHQKLRTDVTVPHAGGGSGAPSLEMMRLRGASLTTYVRGTCPPLRARAISGTVALGYLARAARTGLGRRPARAQEHLAFAQGALTGRAFVGGEEVSARG